MSLLGGLLSNTFTLFNNITGIVVPQIGAFNQVVKDYGFQVSGTGVGFTIQINVSLDGTNWTPLTYLSSTGYTVLLGYPATYVQAVVYAAPTSGNVTVSVAAK